MLLTNAFDPDPRVYQEASSLVQNGYDVNIVCWDRERKAPQYEFIDGMRVERIHLESVHGRGITQILFLLLFWLKAFLRAFNSDFHVVHCHDFDTLPLGYSLARLKKAKLVYDAHESYVDMLENIPKLVKWGIYRFENLLLRRTDLVITVGDILRDHLEDRGALTTCIIGNWKNPDEFVFSNNLIRKERERLEISDDQIVISFIANLGHERQLPQLVEAIKDNPQVFLVVGGNGPARMIVEKASRQYSNICYLGYVDPSKVPFYTALSDIIFYGFDPTNPNAKFSAPNKLFEAIAAGKPILTGDFGEIARIVREQKCGLILDSYSKEGIRKGISALISIGFREFMENSQKAASNEYCWEKARSRLLIHYDMLVGNTSYLDKR
jgi:glycosyltransferase involved in cell wall biosynthesis